MKEKREREREREREKVNTHTKKRVTRVYHTLSIKGNSSYSLTCMGVLLAFIFFSLQATYTYSSFFFFPFLFLFSSPAADAVEKENRMMHSTVFASVITYNTHLPVTQIFLSFLSLSQFFPASNVPQEQQNEGMLDSPFLHLSLSLFFFSMSIAATHGFLQATESLSH